MTYHNNMINLSQAFAVTDEVVGCSEMEVLTVNTVDALDCVLASDQLSRLDLPGFNKSAMDGYAVLEGDDREQYQLLETVAAGSAPTMELKAGTTTKVMTGAPVPAGAGKVIMVEKTTEVDGVVRVNEPEKKSNICLKGEDVKVGDVVLKAPVRLSPLAIANLISAGLTTAPVFRKLKVSILATGDEIVDDCADIDAGKIMNCNGPMLGCLCKSNGFEVVENVIVGDTKEATVNALQNAVENSDIVIMSGGVSVGDFDFVADAMSQLDLKVHFDRVAVKPGKPMTFASKGQTAVFGLPGNPVSVYLMFHLFVLRAVRGMYGLETDDKYLQLPVAGDVKRKNAKRSAFVPCKLNSDGTLGKIDYHGSAHLQALLGSDGFFVMPEGIDSVMSGQRVDFLPLKGMR